MNLDDQLAGMLNRQKRLIDELQQELAHQQQLRVDQHRGFVDYLRRMREMIPGYDDSTSFEDNLQALIDRAR